MSNNGEPAEININLIGYNSHNKHRVQRELLDELTAAKNGVVLVDTVFNLLGF